MLATDRILLRLHIEAVWGVRLLTIEQHDVELLAESPQPSWKLCVAELANERVYIWRPDVSVPERKALRLRVAEVGTSPSTPVTSAGVAHEVAFSLTAPPHIDVNTARSIARPLTTEDRSLVEAFEPGSLDYYFHPARRPLIGVVSAGQVLSLAHSSRRTPEACELGIDTLPQARRKGYALAATILWAHTVQQAGIVPLYSAAATNSASLRLAEAAGYRAFAHVAVLDEKALLERDGS